MAALQFSADLDVRQARRNLEQLDKLVEQLTEDLDIDVDSTSVEEIANVLRNIDDSALQSIAAVFRNIDQDIRGARTETERLSDSLDDVGDREIGIRVETGVAEAEINAFARNAGDRLDDIDGDTATVRLDADDSEGDAAIRDFLSLLTGVDGETVTAALDANNSEALAKIRDTVGELEGVDGTTATARLDADNGDALSKAKEASDAVDEFDGKKAEAELSVDDSQVQAGIDKFGSSLASKIQGVGIAGLISAAIAGGINSGISEGLDIAAGFDEGTAEFEAIGKVRGDLVARGIISSYEEATPVVQSAAKALGEGFTTDELDELTRKLLFFEGRMGVSIQQSLELSGILGSQEFADGASESLDVLLTTAKASNLETAELAELWVEYAGRVDASIVPTEDFIGLLASADTRFAADKILDSFSEFIIKVGEGSDETREAFDSIGVGYDQAVSRIDSGQGTEVFADVLDQLDRLDATQQRVLGEQIIGSVGIDQIGALASANIESIGVQAGATTEALSATSSELALLRNRLSDPLNADRIYEQFEGNGEALGGFLTDPLDQAREEWGLFQEDVNRLSFGLFFDSVNDGLDGLNERIPQTGAAFDQIGDSADRALTGQRAGFEATGAQASRTADNIIRNFGEIANKFDEDFFTYEILVEGQDTVLGSVAAVGEATAAVFDSIDEDAIALREALEAASVFEIEVRANEYQTQLQGLVAITKSAFGNPAALALKEVLGADKIFNPAEYVEAWSKIQAAIREFNTNVAFIESSDIIPDDLKDVWAELLITAGEENGPIMAAALSEAIRDNDQEFIDSIVDPLEEGARQAEIAEIISKGASGLPAFGLKFLPELSQAELAILASSFEALPIELLAQVDDEQLRTIASQTFGVDVELISDRDDILDEIEDIQAEVDLLLGDLPDVPDLDANVNLETSADMLARLSADITQWYEDNPITVDVQPNVGGPMQEGGVAMFSEGASAVQIANRATLTTFGGRLSVYGESYRGPEAKVTSPIGEAIVGPYHASALTANRLDSIGILEQIAPYAEARYGRGPAPVVVVQGSEDVELRKEVQGLRTVMNSMVKHARSNARSNDAISDSMALATKSARRDARKARRRARGLTG